MRRTRGLVVTALTAVLSLGPAAPYASAETRGPAECAAELDCSAYEINLMSMAERIEFVRAMSGGPAAEVIPGYEPRWRNIEGVIDFFRDDGIGRPGSWISFVDAGIVEGIERGIAIALGRSTDTGGNPGSQLWASYLTGLRDGRLTERATHDRAWSAAEQASTEHGVRLAEQVHGIQPSLADQGLYQFSEVYRATLRNRPAPLSPEVGTDEPRQQLFLDWFTDVTNPTPAREGTEFAYRYSQLNPVAGTLGVAGLCHAYAASLLDEFRAATSYSGKSDTGTAYTG